MKIKQILIENLYSAYTYEAEIPLDGNVFIITGPNGYGKTTILNILDNLSKSNLLYFHTLEFDRICLTFETGRRLLIEKEKLDGEMNENEDTSSNQDLKTNFYFREENDVEIASFSLDYQKIKSNGEMFYYPVLEKNYGMRKITIEERMERIVEHDPRIYERIAKELHQEQFLILIQTIDCLYIPAERLHRKKERDSRSSIEEILHKLSGKYQRAYRKFLEEVQREDSDMINCLIDSETEPYSREEYEKKSKQIKEKIAVLSKYGFGSNLNVREYNEQKKEILTVHLKSLEKKTKIIAPFLSKLQVFSKCLDRKQFAHKRIQFNPDTGMTFMSTESGILISPDRLSSGEKNEIILLYYLIFEVKDKTILLIDEPENSLHVMWQSEFVDDIESISEAKGTQVIIATHAPAIIGNKWDKTFDLFQKNGKR